MSANRWRLLAIVLFAAGAVFAGLGNAHHRGWLVAAAFTAFVLGVGAFLRWRQLNRATVFDREEKT